ncbi:bone morphogenetic protein 3 [Trichonephila inaurata madagascariensis]|uniref:Bone morphogenetic protein 3 n=1 Tax=Trichonephila inaurata madagascariensis TaxID=2747483 RepID=A0A8X6MBQ0_9ARAC|nr:bone morphogenetic protein 3 [Trichonephila inaurata madagascariensis]
MTILTLNDTFEKHPKEHSSHLPSSADPVYPSLIVRHPVHQHQQQIPLLLTAHNFPGLTQGAEHAHDLSKKPTMKEDLRRLGNDDILVFNLTGVHPTEYVERVDFHLQSKSSFKQTSRLDQKKSQMEVDILDLSRPQRPKIETIPLTRAQSGSWQTLDITDSIIACLEGEAEQHHLVGVAIKGPEITEMSEVVSQPFLVLFSEDDDHLDIEELGRDANLIRRKREVRNFCNSFVRKQSWWRKSDLKNNPDYEGDDEEDEDEEDGVDDQLLCQKRKMVVSFAEIGWGDWIISPKTFDASYCSGVCPHPLKKSIQSSNHATIQGLIHSLGLKKNIPELCCVPNSLAPVSLLYYDQNKNIVLKSFPDMSVQNCSCR